MIWLSSSSESCQLCDLEKTLAEVSVPQAPHVYNGENNFVSVSESDGRVYGKVLSA